MENSAYLILPALKVRQPLGDFFVVSISARELLDISFSEPLKYIDNSGNVQGSQRPKDEKRLRQIAKYIDSVEMAFPNSIILAANYTPMGNISKDDNERWRVDEINGEYRIIIPKQIKLAAVIDGQHRLNAFEYVTNPDRFDNLQLVCSVYFDLPNSYQAFLFATINSNQKRVDRSLALEQFGYNVDDEPEKAWTPEKFAVFLSRKLNIDKNSPFHQHIKVAPLNAETLFGEAIQNTWIISTATIVDGICELISGNPKRDRIQMQQTSILHGRSRSMIKDLKDISPLRRAFIDGEDQLIYDIILAYFNSVKEILWNKADSKSYIIKTVGVQALFDILRLILLRTNDSPLGIDYSQYLRPSASVDFSDSFFQASGIGRSRIKNIIGFASQLIDGNKIKGDIAEQYNKVDIQQKLGNDRTIERWPWEEETEEAVINALEKVEWNYGNNTVSIVDSYDYDKVITLGSYHDLCKELIKIAEMAFSANLPSDSEIADEEREKFDPEKLVEQCLMTYSDNLNALGWTT